MSLEALEAQLRRDFLAGLAGDRAAYRAFLAAASARLRHYIRGQLARTGRREPADVEDLLQETLLAMHTAQGSYDPASPVTAWLHAIARYKVIDHLRRSGRTPHAETLDDAAHLLGVEDHAATESALDLNRALDRLPTRARALIREVKVQGASVAEAAARAGMSEGAAKVALHRAMRQLARLLGARGEGEG